MRSLIQWLGRPRRRQPLAQAQAVGRDLDGPAAFHRALARELSRAERYHHSLSVLLITLESPDGKPGDARIFVRALEELRVARQVDLAFALGPGRFALLCPHAGPLGARRSVAERLRAAARPLRASIGVAAYPADGTQARILLRRAETACAAARSAGGDQVVAWAELPVAAEGPELEATWRELAIGDLMGLERIRTYLEAGGRLGEVSERRRLGARMAARLGCSEVENHALQGALLLYDVGRIGILDAIWEKPGPLTPEERRIVETHPILGASLLRDHPPAAALVPAVLYHHERFDGTGYPAGLKGNEIPLLARAVHAIDAYLALTRDRPYRPAVARPAALNELWRAAGTQFDPQVVGALAELTEQ